MTQTSIRRLLLVEDNLGDARLIREMLAEEAPDSTHTELTHVQCMSEAETHLARNATDVILLDLGLPDAQGLEAVRRARAAAPRTPLVMLTILDDEALAAHALQGGAQDYLVKGQIDTRTLLRALRYAIDRNASDNALHGSELRFRQLAEAITDVFFIVGIRNSHPFYVSPAYVEIWGRTRESLYAEPHTWLDSVHAEDREYVIAQSAGAIAGKFDYEYRIVRPDGELRWIRIRGYPVLDQGGGSSRTAGVASDITAQKLAERKIKNLNRVHAVLSGISALIVRVRTRDELFCEACRVAVEDGRFLMAWIGIADPVSGLLRRTAAAGDVRDFFEKAPAALTDHKPGSDGFASRAIREGKPLISQDVRNDPQQTMKQELAERGINSLAVIPLVVRGEAMGMLALYAAEAPGFFDDEGMKLLVELADNICIGLEHIRKSEELDYLAYYDPLTGLANRALFLDRVDQQLLTAAGLNQKVAVQVLDIERFKTVNEGLDRKAGDELLKQVAIRLADAGRPQTHFARVAGDHFDGLRVGSRHARIGADHFAVFSTPVQSDEQLAQLTELTLQKCFGPPFLIGDAEVRVSARMGIAVFPKDGADAESLLNHASAAVRKAKGTGERYAFYTQEMHQRSTAALTLENKLRRAFEKQEFVLYYQPKVALGSRRIVGVEALIRWQSPELGLVAPTEFIPLMEERGMILEAGAWALSRAVTDHRRWLAMGLPAPRVAVNVSAVQLRKSDFLTTVKALIGLGARAPGIDLEITESLIMEDIEGNVQKLREIEELGVSIAMDDFGTGYSSLAHLAKLPLQTLKIDRSFIDAMLHDADTMALVQMIISLAHSLRLKVVAEGVELEEQASTLLRLNCDEMQGFLFSRAVPFDDLTGLLQQQAKSETTALLALIASSSQAPPVPHDSH